MIFSDNIKAPKGFGRFLKNLGKTFAQQGKILNTNSKKILQCTIKRSKIVSAAVSKVAKAASSTITDVIFIYHGKGL